ncbi:HU family DNA-binding protein [Ideonella sp. TBM-1]|uniref:HU family DNA-binding protein n=2 Tax=Ideonella livida TaxID=2707176 RepID=A0A7C9TGN3_9BURK|nr:HU family DNA-binding protein [Ideonella livida]
MNKTELIDHLARQADLSKLSATRALEAVLEGITQALARGESVSIPGFGSFSLSQREAGTGRNPRTGEPVAIEAAKLPRFKAGKGLKDAVNSPQKD